MCVCVCVCVCVCDPLMRGGQAPRAGVGAIFLLWATHTYSCRFWAHIVFVGHLKNIGRRGMGILILMPCPPPPVVNVQQGQRPVSAPPPPPARACSSRQRRRRSALLGSLELRCAALHVRWWWCCCCCCCCCCCHARTPRAVREGPQACGGDG